MQVVINKKNLNRISRKSASLIEPSTREKSAFSTISTFRQVKQPNSSILEQDKLKKTVFIKMQNILSFCRHLNVKRDPFDHLAKPKVNFKQQSCKREKQHDSFYQTSRQEMKKHNRLQAMNKTISFSLRKEQIIKSVYEQSPIDLQRQEFKRRHQSLKNYQKFGEQLEQITSNSIISNNLGKLSTQEIIEIKEKRQLQRDFIKSLIKTGQALSNEAVESQELRELCAFLPQKSSHQHQMHHKLEPLLTQANEFQLGKPVLEKYHKLLDKINQSQKIYPVDSYEEYDKALSQRHFLKRNNKKNKNRILSNCAEEWR